jgi:hypothetical protein
MLQFLCEDMQVKKGNRKGKHEKEAGRGMVYGAIAG